MQEVKIAHDWVLENYEKQKFIDAVAKNGATTHLALLRNNISYFSSLDIQMYRARDYCLIPCFLNLLFQVCLISLPINYGVIYGCLNNILFTLCMMSSVFGIGLSILIIGWVCTFKHGVGYRVGVNLLMFLHGVTLIGALVIGIYYGKLSYLMVSWAGVFLLNFPFYFLTFRYSFLLKKLITSNWFMQGTNTTHFNLKQFVQAPRCI